MRRWSAMRPLRDSCARWTPAPARISRQRPRWPPRRMSDIAPTPSPNLELSERIYADWERGDFTATDWADPEIVFEFVDGPEPQRWTGIAGMREGWRGFLSS